MSGNTAANTPETSMAPKDVWEQQAAGAQKDTFKTHLDLQVNVVRGPKDCK